MNHTRKTCDCGNPGCQVCNLFVCSVCELYEGSLTTDCPGHTIPYEKAQDIYAGKIDFRGDEWVNDKNPTNQIWGFMPSKGARRASIPHT